MGHETSKSRERRLREGYFSSIFVGNGIDIGCGDDPVTPDCLRWDKPQGDAQELPGLSLGQFDWVYSSHCLEDLPDPRRALTRWWEILRPGGHLLVVVPDEDLYEQGIWPSRFNHDHKWTFTIHKSRSWSPVSMNLSDLITSLPGHKVHWMRVCDSGYDYSGGIWDRTHGAAEVHIEALVQKVPVNASSPMARKLEIPNISTPEPISTHPFRIYAGRSGQIGDIVCFTPTARRLKQLFPNSQITFAVSSRYRQAGELVAGLPYIDRLFVTDRYFEKLTESTAALWQLGWPLDLRGDDEIREQAQHDLVFDTRPRHPQERWWEMRHQVEECAYMIGVPGPIDLQTEICIPPGTAILPEAVGKIVVHNDPAIDPRKAWPWSHLEALVRSIGPEQIVVLGHPGPELPGTLDLRGQTTLAQAAAIIAAARCYIGIDSGLMWIAGSLQVPTIGLYGTSYIRAYQAIYPHNPHAIYLQAEGGLDRISSQAVMEAMYSGVFQSAPAFPTL